MKKLLLLSIFLLSLVSLSLVSSNEPLEQGVLTVIIQGPGSGTVKSLDGNINCPPTCSYNYNILPVPVTLNAFANPGSIFAEWSGACTGISTTCVINMAQSQSVTATFNLATQTQTLEVTGESIQGSVMAISSTKDYDDDRIITLKNTGTTALTVSGITTSGTFADEDNNPITFTFSNVPSTIAPGETKQVTLHFSVDQDIMVDSYPTNGDGKLLIATTSFTKELGLRVDVTPEEMCEDGRVSDGDPLFSDVDVGNLRVQDIDEPDSGDDFGAGDTIQVSGTVENNADNDLDVIVEVILYNIDQDEVIARAETDSLDVNEDDEEDFDVDLEIPVDSSDLDEDDAYRLFIKVYDDDDGEDENCNYDDIEMEFQREDNQVVVTKTSVTPAVLSCSANANFAVEVKNVGSDDDDRVYVQLREQELGLDYESDTFSLDKFDDRDDTNTITYSFKVPSNAEEKAYNVEAIVVFDGGRETDSEFITLTVRDCGVSSDEGNARISLLQGSISAVPGKLFGFPFKLANLETETRQYLIEITPVGGWASQPQSQLVTLQAGQETTLYSYITPKSDLTSGSYSLNIEVKQDNKVIAKQTAAVQVSSDGGEITGGSAFQPNINLSSIWRNLAGSTAFWIVAIIVLFALVIYVLTILLRPK